MLKKSLLVTTILGAIAVPGVALAQDEAALPIAGNLTFTTDYVFRGISQSDEDFAVQGGFDYAHEATGLYLGTWASNIDFATDGTVELDLYGGWAKSFGDFGAKVGFVHYQYPGVSAFNTDEILVGGSWKWLSANIYYTISDESFGVVDAKGTIYAELNASYTLPAGLVIGAHYGTTMFDGQSGGVANDTLDYDDYKISLGYSYGGFDFGVAYIDNDINNPSAIAEDRVVFNVTKLF